MAQPGNQDEGGQGSVGPRTWAHRDPGDDFLCLRFQVWYPSRDCAIRTKFETAPGCLNCDQGRFNLRRHAGTLHRLRFDFISDEA